MKFKVSVLDLQYAMRTVRDVVPPTGPLSDTAGVRIKVKDTCATFSAFNPEMLVKVTVKVDSEEDGEITLPAGELYSAVSHFKQSNSDGVGTSEISLPISC